jgi:hypothetical protein
MHQLLREWIEVRSPHDEHRSSGPRPATNQILKF